VLTLVPPGGSITFAHAKLLLPLNRKMGAPVYHSHMQHVGALGLALLLTSCTPPRDSATVPPRRAPSPTIVSPNQAPISDVHPLPSASAQDLTIPMWRSPPGDTLGTIGCGETRCRAGKEACVPFASGTKCVRRSAKLKDDFEWVVECDDGSDCPAGSTCCAQHMGGGYCEPRVDNGPPRVCNEERCIPDAGARCPAAERCQLGPDDAWGHCETYPLRATCALGERCGADAGLCVWTYATASGSCGGPVDEKAVEEGRIGLFQCTKPGDCAAGTRCCTAASSAALGTFCAPATELANSTYLCDSDEQCRKGMQKPFHHARCVPASRDETFKDYKYPPWVSVCRFE